MKNLENEVINKLYSDANRRNICKGMQEAFANLESMLHKWLPEEHSEDDIYFWLNKLEHEAFCAGAERTWNFLTGKEV